MATPKLVATRIAEARWRVVGPGATEEVGYAVLALIFGVGFAVVFKRAPIDEPREVEVTVETTT